MPLPSQRTVVERDRSRFRILTVCTGNLCRSPQAEQLLRAGLQREFGSRRTRALIVESAGTMGFDGQRMDAQALAEAERLGVGDAEAHRARRIRPAHVDDADLVLGMSREHRGAAASLMPSANRRSFSLVEFMRILEAIVDRTVQVEIVLDRDPELPALMHAVVEAAGVARSLTPAPAAQAELDIVDPHRLSPEVYRESADLVDDSVRRIVAAILTIRDRLDT